MFSEESGPLSKTQKMGNHYCGNECSQDPELCSGSFHSPQE